jgi:hypothetical protein
MIEGVENGNNGFTEVEKEMENDEKENNKIEEFGLL